METNKVFGPGGGKVGETDKLNIDSIIARLLEGKRGGIYILSPLLLPFVVIPRPQSVMVSSTTSAANDIVERMSQR